MKMEQVKAQLAPLKLTSSPDGGLMQIVSSGKSYKLSALQFHYLQVLQNNSSLEELVRFFLQQGWLVNFRELMSLMQFLYSQGVLLNSDIRDYFSEAMGAVESKSSASTTSLTVNAKTLPFFRTLEPQLAEYLLKPAVKVRMRAGEMITRTGDSSRDLFVILNGVANVYKNFGANQRQLVSRLSAGSIFGERGFLLNQARNADIAAFSDLEVLRVPYLPEYDQLIKSDRAQSLQHRFWVLQALLSSDFFKELPTDTLDALIFSGKLVKAHAHQTLFQEGQPGNTCYVLVQGAVNISQHGKVINVLKQGSCFGEIALLISGGTRTATVTTELDSILLEIHQNDFYKMLSLNLFLAKEIETLAANRIARDQQRR
jgi:CRP-like cAMP-binding protein